MKAIIPPEEMKIYWEDKAKKDALFWTWSNHVPEKEYFKSGEDWVENCVKKYFPISRGKCVEIGCGVGRVTLSLAKYFNKVTGMDISTKMIERAKVYKDKFGVNNVEYIDKTDLILYSEDVDFIFTLTVFQHMHEEIWMQYVKDGYEVLKKGGRFYVHALFNSLEERVNDFIKIGYKVIVKEQEGDCWIVILEKS